MDWMDSSSSGAWRFTSDIARSPRIEQFRHLLISVVGCESFFPVFAERFHNGCVLNREQNCPFSGRSIDMFVVSPAGNGKNVPLFPIKTNSRYHGGAASFKHVVNGTIHLSMRPCMHTRPKQLNPGGDRVHH